jgi:hypothetical protein
MAAGDYWSDSQRRAWQYVLSAQDQGLGEVAALTEYRSGGGAIRTTSWVELWHRADQASSTWDNLYTLGGSDTVPESMFAETGINYKQKYIATFTFSMLGADGKTITTEYRTVESNTRLTLDEWKEGLGEAAFDYATGGYGNVREISSIEFSKNMNL